MKETPCTHIYTQRLHGENQSPFTRQAIVVSSSTASQVVSRLSCRQIAICALDKPRSLCRLTAGVTTEGEFTAFCVSETGIGLIQLECGPSCYLNQMLG